MYLALQRREQNQNPPKNNETAQSWCLSLFLIHSLAQIVRKFVMIKLLLIFISSLLMTKKIIHQITLPICTPFSLDLP